jgi:HSP20 family protein
MHMAISRWDPFRDLNLVQERLNRIFGDVPRASDDVMSRGTWLPAVDIYNNGNHELVIKAELPGLNREAIELTIENNTLTLHGEKKYADDVREEQYHRVERTYGSFSRTFALPPTVDVARVNAEYKDGVLTVRLPLRDEAKPKQIKVDVAA